MEKEQAFEEKLKEKSYKDHRVFHVSESPYRTLRSAGVIKVDMRERYYINVFRRMLDKKNVSLSPMAMLCYMCLLKGISKINGPSYTDIQEMTETLDCSKRTIYRALNELLEEDLVARTNKPYAFHINPLHPSIEDEEKYGHLRKD